MSTWEQDGVELFYGNRERGQEHKMSGMPQPQKGHNPRQQAQTKIQSYRHSITKESDPQYIAR